ncbi:MAG TPA: hypothetical protein VFR38_04465 [Gaiellaceae bacterium]|nr:hypothetical protein [Gaiellaceae bacterium]
MTRTSRRRRGLLTLLLGLQLTVLLVASPIGRAHVGPDLTPATVDEVIFPGGSVQIDKTVHLPAFPPVFDLCLVQDETGSFFDDLPVLAAQIPGLIAALDASGSDYATCVVGYRDFAQNGWGDAGDWVYRRTADVTAGGAGFTAGVPLLTASGGNDLPEAQLEALHYLSTPAHPAIDSNGDADTTDANDTPAGQQPTWRAGSQRIVLLTTDAECHVQGDTGGWPGDAGTASPAVTAAALTGADITLIGLTPGGAGTIACVDSLAAGTGGSVQAIGASSETIADAILDALAEIEVQVFMRSDCTTATGGVVTTTFSPNPQTGTGGSDLVFTETISVSASAPGGTYTCRDWAVVVTADGTATNLGDNPATPEDETIYERKTIRVPEGFLTAGGQINNGNGPNAERISWGGNVGFLADFSAVGQWNTNFHDVDGTTLDGAHFHAPDFSSLQFVNDGGAGPSPPPANANIALFVADGELNGVPGYMLRVCVADRGEPGKGNDTMRMQLFAPGPVLVYDSLTDFADQAPASACDGHELDGGNIQIHSGVKS